MSISNILQPNNFPIQGGSGVSITGGFTVSANATLLNSIVVQTGKIVSATVAVQLLVATPPDPAQLNLGTLTGVGFPPYSASSISAPAADPGARGTCTVSNAGGVFTTGGTGGPYSIGELVICTFTYAVN